MSEEEKYTDREWLLVQRHAKLIAEIKQDNKQEITDLKQRHKALEDVDDIAGSYRDGWERMLEALEEEDFCRCLGKFRKEFEEIKNA